MPYTNLPGFASVLRDTRMFLTPQTGATRNSIIILGTATDGPVDVPYAVDRVDQADKVFGSYFDEGATLLPMLHEAVSAGAGDIRLMRVGGAQAALATELTATIKVDGVDTVAKKVLKIKAKYNGAKYNAVKVKVDATHDLDDDLEGTTTGPALVITSASGLHFHYALDATKYTTVGALANAINADDNDVLAEAGTEATLASIFAATPAFAGIGASDTALTGGSDGTDMDQATLKSTMETALGYLEDYEVDIVVLAGLYVTYTLAEGGGVVASEAAKMLAKHCYTASQRVKERHGVIAVQPLDTVNLTTVKQLYETLIKDSNKNEYTHDTEVAEDGSPLDLGKYISVIVAEPIVNDARYGYYRTDGTAVYAGLITTLVAESATTNKTIAGVAGLNFAFSPGQMDAITAKRYVTFRNKVLSGVVVTDGVTAAQFGSDYSRLSTVRIISAAVNGIRQVTEPYIGQAGTPQHFNAMQTAIEASLAGMKTAGAITDYRFTILASPVDIARGEATIELEVVPAFELRRIKTVVTIRPSLQ
jgi:hypothetical protein